MVTGAGGESIWVDIPRLRANSSAVSSTDLPADEQLADPLAVLGKRYVGRESPAIYAGYGADLTVWERHPGHPRPGGRRYSLPRKRSTPTCR